jgi:hypothetical protein
MILESKSAGSSILSPIDQHILLSAKNRVQSVMVRPISTETRKKILELWMTELVYEDISAKTGVSKGAISSIINEVRDAIPDLLDLRRLMMDLNKTGVSLDDARSGAALMVDLEKLRVTLAHLGEFIVQNKELTTLGFTTHTATVLAKELLKHNLDPVNASRILVDALAESPSLRQHIEGQRLSLAKLQEEYKKLARRKSTLEGQINALSDQIEPKRGELAEAKEEMGKLEKAFSEFEEKMRVINVSKQEAVRDLGLVEERIRNNTFITTLVGIITDPKSPNRDMNTVKKVSLAFLSALKTYLFYHKKDNFFVETIRLKIWEIEQVWGEA